MISKGKSSARQQLKARILLKADQGCQGEGWTDARICEAFATNMATVETVRRKMVEEGLEAALSRKKRQTQPTEPIFDGEKQAQLIALACSDPPSGYSRWAILLLAKTVVEREIVSAAHFNTIGCTSERKQIEPHLRKQWVIPLRANGAFVAAVEEELTVFKRPYDPERPLVCLDETSKQLIAETRTPLPMAPGQPTCKDYEYRRNGTANLFMLFAPLKGWRHVKIIDRRTLIDYAQALEELSDTHFAHARNLCEIFTL